MRDLGLLADVGEDVVRMEVEALHPWYRDWGRGPSAQRRNGMRAPRTARPMVALFDTLERRWALRIIWELRDGPLSFRALAVRCGRWVPTQLTRLHELRAANLVEHRAKSGYTLTPAGVALLELIRPMEEWSKHWVRP